MRHYKTKKLLFWLFALLTLKTIESQRRIAVIGGGISGAFVSKYLVDYDVGCELNLTLFDPSPIGTYKHKESNATTQGNCVETYQLENGHVIELGASLLSDIFFLVKEMATNGDLSLGSSLIKRIDESQVNPGFLIYNGNKEPSFFFNASTFTERNRLLAFRYNIELYRIAKAARDTKARLEELHDAILDDNTNQLFTSMEEVWKYAGLSQLSCANQSFADYSEQHLWVPKQIPWWRNIRGQGSIQREVLSMIGVLEYSQDIESIPALAGLISIAALSGPFFTISGGNVKLISSAWEQAQTNSCKNCKGACRSLNHINESVSTIVGSLDGFNLFARNGTLLGRYDVVVLTVPLSVSKIDLLTQSHIDQSVLQPMPLGNLIKNEDDHFFSPEHEGHIQLPKTLPDAVVPPHKKIFITFVRDGALRSEVFGFPTSDVAPKVYFMTEMGTNIMHDILAIVEISRNLGVYKIFSSRRLSIDVLRSLFDSTVIIEYESDVHNAEASLHSKNGEFDNFLLFDAAVGFHGHTKSGALYHTTSRALSLPCMESNAMGAKLVARQIAARFEWLNSSRSEDGFAEEL